MFLRAVPAALFAALPATAWAHAPEAGVAGFYSGLAHPFTLPGAVMAVVALGLVTGQRGDATFLAIWPAFAASALAGLAISLAAATIIETNLALLVFAASAGLLAATALALPRLAAMALAALAGLLVGAACAPDPGPIGASIVTASGALLAAAIGYLFVSGLTLFMRERFTRPWVSVALRVAGSWILAISAMMAALSLAPRPSTAGIPVHLLFG